MKLDNDNNKNKRSSSQKQRKSSTTRRTQRKARVRTNKTNLHTREVKIITAPTRVVQRQRFREHRIPRNALRPHMQLQSTLSQDAKRFCLSTLLPYQAKPLRVRAENGGSTYTIASAVAKHFNYKDLNLAQLIQPNLVCGVTARNLLVFPDMHKQISVVSILDPRVIAIVPNVNSISLAEPNMRTYRVSKYLNNNMISDSNFNIDPSYINGFPEVETSVELNAMVDPIWFDFGDWTPGVTYGGNPVYGEIHPPVDTDLGRFIWIDSNPNVNGGTSFVSMQFNTNLSVANIGAADGEVLTLIIQRLGTTHQLETDYEIGKILITGNANAIGTVGVQGSGYYRIGMTGKFTLTTATPAPLVLQNLTIFMQLGNALQVFAQHWINKHLFVSDGARPFFATQQTNGGSLLIKNSTPALSAGGMIYGTCSVTDVPWWVTTSNNNARDEFSDSTLRYEGELSKGIYGWLRPAVRGFRSCTATNEQSSGSVGSALRSYSISRKTSQPSCNQAGMNIYTIFPPVSTDSTVQTTLTLVSCVSFEFTTTNQTPILSSDAIEIEDILAANKFLNSVPTFTENPLHISAFTDAIRNAFNSAKEFYSDNRKSILPIMDAVSSFGDPVVSTIGKVWKTLDGFVFG